jgi:hypothetical protein
MHGNPVAQDGYLFGRVKGNSMRIFLMALTLWTWAAAAPLTAQQWGRPQDGFYSGQANGQVDTRIDGRANHNEGLPPSAADRANRIFDNPVNQTDCVEVDAIAPDARPGWQARVRAACGED